MDMDCFQFGSGTVIWNQESWLCVHQPCPTLCNLAFQAPLSMGFSRQEYWSGLPCLFSRESSWPRGHICVTYLLHWRAGCSSPAPPLLQINLLSLSGSLWESCSFISCILTGAYMPFFIPCHFSTVIKKLKTFFLSVCTQEETFEECPMRHMKRYSLKSFYKSR